MIWLLTAISICLVNVVAGRAYSRHLDELEARAHDPVKQYLNGLPLTSNQLEAANSFDSEKQASGSVGRSRAAQTSRNFRAA
jgi:hypothetical protein